MSSPSDPKTPSKLAGRLAVLGAALLWSLSALFAKAPIFTDWPIEERGAILAFWRALFASLVLLPTVRRPRWRGYLVPLVLCFAGMNVTYLTAMTRTTAANAIWLQSTAPWWVFLFAVLCFHEPVVRRDLVPLLFGMVGVVTILGFELSHSTGIQLSGVILGLVSGVFFAGVVIFMRQLREENSAWLVALNHAVAAMLLLPVVLWLNRWPSPGQLAVLVGFGVFQMALPYLLLIRGLRAISSVEAMAIGLIEPMLIPIWALIWNDKPAWWTLVGASLIFLGLVLRYVVLELLVPNYRRRQSRGQRAEGRG